MYSEETEVSKDFSITFSGDEVQKAINQCPGKSGCDFILKEETVTDLFTHSVTFKAETGGTIDGGTDDIVYSGLMDNVDFPKVPTTEEDSSYTFKGWYDKDGEKVTTWPEKVTEDMVFTAKFEKNPEPVVDTNKNLNIDLHQDFNIDNNLFLNLNPIIDLHFDQKPLVTPGTTPRVEKEAIDEQKSVDKDKKAKVDGKDKEKVSKKDDNKKTKKAVKKTPKTGENVTNHNIVLLVSLISLLMFAVVLVFKKKILKRNNKK